MHKRRHERPLRRVNPSGKIVWVARWTDRSGKQSSAGTFELKRDAQAAIDAAYERAAAPQGETATVGTYFDGEWLLLNPRTERTARSYQGRIRSLLDVDLERRPFRDWPMREVERRHAKLLLGVLLVDQGRAASGAQGVLRALSAMWQDAVEDDRAGADPFSKLRVRASDPRVVKAPRRIRTWSWEDMHRFAAEAAAPVEHDLSTLPVQLRPYVLGEGERLNEWRAAYAEPMIRVMSDCGLRLGELLALYRTDFKPGRCDERDCPLAREEMPHLHVRRTAWEGRLLEGTKNDHGEADAGRVAPVAPGLLELLGRVPRRIDTRLLFPMVSGRVWTEANWRRDVWTPPRGRLGVGMTPHEMRHTWVSAMRAAAIDPADVAAAAGHSVETATRHYTHALGLSFEAMRRAVGE